METQQGHCPRCGRWFLIENASYEAFHRCPVCLSKADRYEPALRTVDDPGSQWGENALCQGDATASEEN